MGASAKRRELRRLRFHTEEFRDALAKQDAGSDLQMSETESPSQHKADLAEGATESQAQDETEDIQTGQESSSKEDRPTKHHRFICFIGNIPYVVPWRFLNRHRQSTLCCHHGIGREAFRLSAAGPYSTSY